MIPNDIINALKESKKVGITFHTSPDGDSLGSALGLMQGLLKLDKEVYIISKDNVPSNYNFLPHIDKVTSDLNCVIDGTDCVIVLDCGNIERVSANLGIESKKYCLINIDHHLSNNMYGDLNFVDTKSSAVGEIIYRLLESLKVNLDRDIATCLYTSIVSDTGGFKHSNTTQCTHSIAGSLINLGINFSEIHRMLFQNKKFKNVKLLGKVIDNMYLIYDEKVCVMRLYKRALDELNLEASDTSDIISFGIDIDTVEVAILIKESEEGTKISLRSKSYVDVRKIAECFGGGGHIRASGMLINESLEEAEKLILNIVEKELI